MTKAQPRSFAREPLPKRFCNLERLRAVAHGLPNGDWTLEEGMVTPMHLLYPGGERSRWWLEEVVVIGKDGGRPLFSWGFGPLTGGGQGIR